MNVTETLSNNNSTIIVLIGYSRKSFANLHIYKIKNGKLFLLQKMYLESESVRTFIIHNQFYFLSLNRLGTGSIYKWTNSSFVFVRNVEHRFNYFKSENGVIVTVENERIQFYTQPELTGNTSDSLPITNQTDFIIHRDYLMEFYIERYKMTIKFRKFEKNIKNEKTDEKSRNNSLYDCLKSVKTDLIERQKKIKEVDGNSAIPVEQEQVTVRSARIERIKVNLKPVISPKELMKRITVLEMRLDDFVRRKRETDQVKLSTIVVNNLIHTGDIFKGEFHFIHFGPYLKFILYFQISSRNQKPTDSPDF